MNCSKERQQVVLTQRIHGNCGFDNEICRLGVEGPHRRLRGLPLAFGECREGVRYAALPGLSQRVTVRVLADGL